MALERQSVYLALPTNASNPYEKARTPMINDSSETRICVPLQEILEVFLLLEDLNAFLHQPLHYDDDPKMDAFLGTVKNGAYHDLHKGYYYTVCGWLPKEVREELRNRP